MAELQKKLGFWEVFCIATGAMISSGLFILPGLAFAHAGPAVAFSYLIAGLACIPTVLSMSELTSAMPKAGGDYFYITRGFGPFVGTVAGMGSWFALSLKSAWALIGMGAYLRLLTPFPLEWIAVTLCLFFVILNIVGVKEAGKMQVILVSGLILILLAYIGWGGFAVEKVRLSPFFPMGRLAMFSTAGFVFIAYGGLTQIVAMAEEVDEPERNIFLGMIASLAVTVVLYFLVVLVTVGVVDADTLKGTLLPISKGAEAFAGGLFQKVVSVAAFLAFISTGNAGIMSAARYLLGMSRDGHLPSGFGRVSRTFHTPHIAIIFTGMVIMFSLIALELELLVKVGSAILILLYVFANAAVILFRNSRIQTYRPSFRSPFYPYMHIAGIIVGLFMLLEVETGVLFLTMMFFLACAMLYKYTAHKKVVRDSALGHILGRLIAADKELTAVDVTNELKDIAISRNNLKEESYYKNLKQEKFDVIMDSGSVLDLDEPLKMEAFFRRVAGVISVDTPVDRLVLLRRFVEREEMASTVVEKGIAMPHLVVEGKDIMKVVFARAKTGVIFPGDKIVHLLIVVVSSFDQRHMHLRLLAHFVNMVESPDFDTEWFMEMDAGELKKKVLEFIGRRFA